MSTDTYTIPPLGNELHLKVTPELRKLYDKAAEAFWKRDALRKKRMESPAFVSIDDMSLSGHHLQIANEELGLAVVRTWVDQQVDPQSAPIRHFISGDYLSIKQDGYTLQLRVSDAATFQASLEQHKAKTEAEIAYHQRELALINAVLEGKSTSDPGALR